LEVAAGIRPVEDMPAVIPQKKRRKRLKIADALDAAGKYKAIGESAAMHFRNFAKMIKVKFMDEVTPELAFDYLCKRFPSGSGKSYNNCKSAVNAVFKLTLLDSGLTASPFDLIPSRINNGKHQRPFTEEEFRKIFSSAPEPWKSASIIAWFTGLREKDVFVLRWNQIDLDVITTTPAKTSRFGRGVRIPVHPQLAEYLERIPQAGERVLGAWQYCPEKRSFKQQFSKLLKKLDIGENSQGIVNFNSFRDSFITRCDAAGIPRHATRGIVGHISDNQTDLYSHDLDSARLTQRLPWVELD
jgi:integrase